MGEQGTQSKFDGKPKSLICGRLPFQFGLSSAAVLGLHSDTVSLQRKMITGRWGRQTKSALKQDFFLLKMGFKCIFLKPLLQSFIPLFIPLQCQ
ncbi:hypothetical protein DW080_09725 [Bacteroides caccae]|nr:MAG: hypothetical protein BHV68_12165 [Bacteroidales bacterium 43_8]RHK11443.1 hypothetical protein DW080_09725 [Bacteroides caccae]RHM92256.1 hypothetical protein DWZ35_15220 [Bacteroides caccae]RYU03791.1 hypothetical protein EAJ00_12605 [Bacteroides caccae]